MHVLDWRSCEEVELPPLLSSIKKRQMDEQRNENERQTVWQSTLSGPNSKRVACMALDFVHVFALLNTWFNSIIQRIIIFALLAGPIPNHVAFIMDGNRRFARRHNEPVAKGHDQGSQALRRVCQPICCCFSRSDCRFGSTWHVGARNMHALGSAMRQCIRVLD